MKYNKGMFIITKENERKLFVKTNNDYVINSGNKDEKESEINNDEYTIYH